MSGRDPQKWVAVVITVAPPAAEAVEYAFNTLRSLGTEISSFPLNTSADGVDVIGYFEQQPDETAIKTALDDALSVYGAPPRSIISINTHIVPETDWLAEWKKHWKPARVGPFVIAPPWADLSKTCDIVVRIEPNMAFGTGTHETTQLCLEAIGENLRDGMSFLDVGTGTGILAIAAAKLLTRSKITACDVDADAITIARENAKANHVGEVIEFFTGTIDKGTGVYDLVCANLTLDVITPMLSMLIAKTKHQLILSGILVEQESAIAGALSKFDISNFRFAHSGEWISALIDKQ